MSNNTCIITINNYICNLMRKPLTDNAWTWSKETAQATETILSITEAYSQSPMTFTISTELKHSKASEYLAKKLIKVITRQGDRYNGYNFDGQIVFSYLVDSVNVCYNTDNV